MFSFFRKPLEMPTAETALPGRSTPIPHHQPHRVFGLPLDQVPEGTDVAVFGLGCFWGAERLFWRIRGVRSTAAGYAGGFTPNPTYEEVCSGRTGHNEVVWVAFDPGIVSYEALVVAFFEAHDPTQGMRQGNDVGTQYRSGLYPTSAAQREVALRLRAQYDARLRTAGYPPITTEVVDGVVFHFAEPYHQQYLEENPDGYCGLRGTGVSCAG